jgi:hypothetical protein
VAGRTTASKLAAADSGWAVWVKAGRAIEHLPAVLPWALNTMSLSAVLAQELTDARTWSNLPPIDVQT